MSFPQGTPLSGSQVVPNRGSALRPPLRFRPRRKRRQTLIHPVLSQDLFADALSREFRRADRFEESFALLQVGSDRGPGFRGWSSVIDALAPTLSDTDVIGWLEHEAVIGIIRPLTHLQPQEAAIILTETVQRELLRSLRSQEAGHCSIRLEVHSASSQTVTTARPANGRAEQARSVVRDVLKRLLDIAGSAALLALLSPVFLVIAALIKVSSKGPVLFRQPRVGQCGRRFTMFKFRTMHVNADEAVHQQYVARFIESGATATATSDKVFKIVDDPRVTPLGHFLRRSSLDELPQFWNVFRGEMSLVGPRPPLAYEVQRYKRWHLRRLWEAKPGITGLWQVKGRSRTTFDEMVRLDLQYAKTHSLWTDIKILLATPLAVVSGKGAH